MRSILLTSLCPDPFGLVSLSLLHLVENLLRSSSSRLVRPKAKFDPRGDDKKDFLQDREHQYRGKKSY